ncbi:hypothetical protein K435DRAFT_871652 [Dendrothele bispora CBS 962.96]|uniref:Uncharacterized protein n=1 Tax=Dendrothele bispora (strain CBS 962.96) TaxID=1314807 RepID=A0A4S8L3Z6_DENBC|nr:hypothetical protein K435DRAFT_871652 [Dendrothele bispora CBS 962.96]
MAPIRRPRGSLSVAQETKLVHEQIALRAQQLNGGKAPTGRPMCPTSEHPTTLRGSNVWLHNDNNFGKYYTFCKTDRGNVCHFNFLERCVTGNDLASDPVMSEHLASKRRLNDPNQRHLLPTALAASVSRPQTQNNRLPQVASSARRVSSRSSPPPTSSPPQQASSSRVGRTRPFPMSSSPPPTSSPPRQSSSSRVRRTRPFPMSSSPPPSSPPRQSSSTPAGRSRPFPMSSPPRGTRFSTPEMDRGPALSSPIRSSSTLDIQNVYTPQTGLGCNKLHLTRAVTALVYQDADAFETCQLPLRKSANVLILNDHKLLLGQFGLETVGLIQRFTRDGVWEDAHWREPLAFEPGEIVLLKPKGMHVML